MLQKDTFMNSINHVEDLISDLCSIVGDRTKQTSITKSITFPSFPEESGATPGETEIEKTTFVGETLHKAIIHLMEARKLMFTLGFRFEEESS